MNSDNKQCYFCGAENFKIFCDIGSQFLQCKRCGLISMASMPEAAKLAAHYNHEYYKSDYQGRGRQSFSDFSYRLRIFDKFFKKPGKFLEVGAASGEFLQLMRERDWQVAGVEISATAVAAAQKNYGLSIFRGTLEAAHFTDHSFDAVAFYHVLEHLPDPLAALEKARKILKPDGLLMIELPNPGSFDAKVSRDLLASIVDYPNHLYLWPRKTILAMLRQSGWQAVFSEHSFSFAIASLINKIRGRTTSVTAASNDKMVKFISKPVGSGGIKKIVRDFLAKIFPGMRLTLVAKPLHE